MKKLLVLLAFIFISIKTKTNILFKRFVIVKNIDDHVGYTGQSVRISKTLEDNYLEVIDSKGNVWTVGEEEIEEIPV